MAKKKATEEKELGSFDVLSPTGEYIRTYDDKEVAEGFASKVSGRTVVPSKKKEEEPEEVEE